MTLTPDEAAVARRALEQYRARQTRKGFSVGGTLLAFAFWVLAALVAGTALLWWLGWPVLVSHAPDAPAAAQLEPQHNRAADTLPALSAPPVAPQGRSSNNVLPASAPVDYPLTMPGAARAAWSPEQAPTLDVSNRRYRIVEARAGATLAELDDGVQVWLVAPPADVVPVIVPQAADTQAAPTLAPVDTWGPGGTSGGATWEPQPTALPLQNAILPALPAIEQPTPTWGEGGSSGGATW